MVDRHVSLHASNHCDYKTSVCLVLSNTVALYHGIADIHVLSYGVLNIVLQYIIELYTKFIIKNNFIDASFTQASNYSPTYYSSDSPR